MLSSKELAKLKKQVTGFNHKITRFFDALGDTNRFKIFMLLMQSRHDICVTEFAEICNISVPAASQQLKSLELSGLINRVRTGQTTCYKIRYDDPQVKMIVEAVQTTG